MEHFDDTAQNNDYKSESDWQDIQRFMDSRDYSDHSYDMNIETDQDLKSNIQNIQEFMDAEVRNENG